jgi:hypothetical protein
MLSTESGKRRDNVVKKVAELGDLLATMVRESERGERTVLFDAYQPDSHQSKGRPQAFGTASHGGAQPRLRKGSRRAPPTPPPIPNPPWIRIGYHHLLGSRRNPSLACCRRACPVREILVCSVTDTRTIATWRRARSSHRSGDRCVAPRTDQNAEARRANSEGNGNHSGRRSGKHADSGTDDFVRERQAGSDRPAITNRDRNTGANRNAAAPHCNGDADTGLGPGRRRAVWSTRRHPRFARRGDFRRKSRHVEGLER